MKTFKSLIILLFCTYCSIASAQTTYKRVTIDRDYYDNQVIVVRNDNSCAATIRMEYKVGSKEAEWKYFDQWDSGMPFDAHEGNTIKANSTVKFNVYSKIYALKLTYVHLEVGEVIKEGIDAFVEGWNEGKKQQQN